MPDQCRYVDQQNFKLQEAPEVVPTGEMPRNILLSVDRALVDRVSPGTRVSVLGICSLFSSGRGAGGKAQASVRQMYLKVVGVCVESAGAGRANALFTPEEEQRFVELAADPNIYARLCDAIAPSISGKAPRYFRLLLKLKGKEALTMPSFLHLAFTPLWFV
jgi:DNA replication licensing factor MCM5